MNFREFFSEEIVVFFEQIFLRILHSGNSSFSHRFYALQVLAKLFFHHKIIIEFFINYDCEINHSNIVEKLFETLSKISQGRYLKEEFILQPGQELSLRNLALESLNSFMKELDKAVEFENMAEETQEERGEEVLRGFSMENVNIKDFGCNDTDK